MLRLSTVNVVMPIGGANPVAFSDWLKAQLGEHPSVAQHRLGHASSRMTLDLYTMVSETMDRHAADLLEDHFNGDLEPRVRV